MATETATRSAAANPALPHPSDVADADSCGLRDAILARGGRLARLLRRLAAVGQLVEGVWVDKWERTHQGGYCRRWSVVVHYNNEMVGYSVSEYRRDPRMPGASASLVFGIPTEAKEAWDAYLKAHGSSIADGNSNDDRKSAGHDAVYRSMLE